ncbi:MAG: TMEM175 family protein [Candidatus Dormibacteria bacterium]
MSTGRVEAFSDGVFAVAITLLVLDLRIPITRGSLITALADEWPVFVAFLLSFMVIGIVWVNHHTLFHQLQFVDRPLLFFNLALLMTVVLIPFATSLFAQYVSVPGEQASVAAALFNGSQLVMGMAFQLCGSWVHAHPELRRPGSPVATPLQRLRTAAGVFFYVLCIPVAFVSPLAVLVIDGAVAVYYVLDQFTLATAE